MPGSVFYPDTLGFAE